MQVDCLNENDSSALSEASVGGADGVLELLLRHGAASASVGGADGVLELLLRHGAASVINVADNHGRTPVFRAAFMGKASAIRILLKYGADASILNKHD
ncbi:hypothetical protein T484DRAFT_1784774 [Baffinella frigidus]|nr:hypothetical protein T484DRAFT_1784774 [Cryptophyta sp. CCMP2293]